jgi:hypothetical protein
MSRLIRTTATLAAALVAVAGLTACSEQRLGAAAVVDGDRISTDQVQQATASYLKVVPGSDTATAQRAILERIILSDVIDKAAEKEGVHASAAQVAAERNTLLKSVGGRKGLVRALSAQQQPTVLAPSYVDRWFKDRLLYTKIAKKIAAGGDPTSAAVLTRTSNSLAAAAKSMTIEVNPRYGTWDPNKGVTALVGGGLSKTANQLNAS